jgi:NADPH2:quinone reductase
MKAVRVHDSSGPKGLNVDTLEDPKPVAGEVIVEVRAAGLNFPDVLLSYGKYQFKPAPPFIPGGEASGIVKSVGAGVASVKEGDRVAFTLLNGAFAELVAAPEMAVVKLPDAISFEVGAATLLTYLTTIHALVDRAAIRKGETLLVLGAAGGVGVAAIQLGKLLGAKVLAAVSTEEKAAFCKEQGADETIVYSREDLKERVKVITSGNGANVVYDAVGGNHSEQALRATAWEGRYLVVGFAAGDIPKIPLNLVLLKGCQIVGVFWGQFAMRDPARNNDNAKKIFSWVAEGKLKPHVDGAFPFARATEAFERMEQRLVKGKVVLVP